MKCPPFLLLALFSMNAITASLHAGSYKIADPRKAQAIKEYMATVKEFRPAILSKIRLNREIKDGTIERKKAMSDGFQKIVIDETKSPQVQAMESLNNLIDQIAGNNGKFIKDGAIVFKIKDDAYTKDPSGNKTSQVVSLIEKLTGTVNEDFGMIAFGINVKTDEQIAAENLRNIIDQIGEPGKSNEVNGTHYERMKKDDYPWFRFQVGKDSNVKNFKTVFEILNALGDAGFIEFESISTYVRE